MSDPINPNASKEARELLNLFYNVSGKGIMTGQHNQPVHGDMWTRTISKMTGKTPLIWGQEIGFSKEGTLDGINFRKQNVDFAKAMHSLGHVVTFTWHIAAPDVEEPVEFYGGIIRELTPQQRTEMLRDGFPLNKKLKQRWDIAADMLAELQGFGCPVLWRPFHECNGPWFWFNGNGDAEFLKKMWKMQYDYFTNEKKLNNLIWCWSPNGYYDNPFGHPGKLQDFHPGRDLVDVYAIDLYDAMYTDDQYRYITECAGDKPVGIGECAELITPEQMKKYPRYCYYLAWADLVVLKNKKAFIKQVMNDSRAINLEDVEKYGYSTERDV